MVRKVNGFLYQGMPPEALGAIELQQHVANFDVLGLGINAHVYDMPAKRSQSV